MELRFQPIARAAGLCHYCDGNSAMAKPFEFIPNVAKYPATLLGEGVELGEAIEAEDRRQEEETAGITHRLKCNGL
jgi:hypothetical protein